MATNRRGQLHAVPKSVYPKELSPARIVRAARRRRGLSQAAFAAEIGCSQAEVSRYENSLVDPPGDLLIQCMTAIGLIEPQAPISAEQLATRVRKELSSPDRLSARTAVWRLLDALSTH